jgi:hypothetical protein
MYIKRRVFLTKQGQIIPNAPYNVARFWPPDATAAMRGGQGRQDSLNAAPAVDGGITDLATERLLWAAASPTRQRSASFGRAARLHVSSTSCSPCPPGPPPPSSPLLNCWAHFACRAACLITSPPATSWLPATDLLLSRSTQPCSSCSLAAPSISRPARLTCTHQTTHCGQCLLTLLRHIRRSAHSPLGRLVLPALTHDSSEDAVCHLGFLLVSSRATLRLTLTSVPGHPLYTA